jgi:heat shock protein HslJ
MKAAFAALGVLVLAACSPAPPSDGGQPSAAATSPAASSPPAAADDAGADVRSSLAAYHWRLADATDGIGTRIDDLFARADHPLQLDFDAGNVSVSNSCNRMRGSWSLAGDELTFGKLASTLMACGDAKLMTLDAAVGRYLAGTMHLTLETDDGEPRLTLRTERGATLRFAGAPTAQTRYGGPGETRFLEVAAQDKPCDAATAAAATVAANAPAGAACLEVRELHYDANGLRSGEPGPWHALPQGIEGYEHEPGIRNVVRVQRYRPAAVPAGASSAVYVLDMVVESQRPPPR